MKPEHDLFRGSYQAVVKKQRRHRKAMQTVCVVDEKKVCIIIIYYFTLDYYESLDPSFCSDGSKWMYYKRSSTRDTMIK